VPLVVRGAGSQYTVGGVSACTPMAVEACLQLLGPVSFDDPVALRQALDQALFNGEYRLQEHLTPDAVLKLPRYAGRLHADPALPALLCAAHEAAAQQIPLSALDRLLARLGDVVTWRPPAQARLALVLVKPPETISVVAAAHPGGPAFAVFDSHPRPGEPSAVIAVFGSAAAAAGHLSKRVWPLDSAALSDVSEADALQLTTVDFTPVSLAAPPVPPAPRPVPPPPVNKELLLQRICTELLQLVQERGGELRGTQVALLYRRLPDPAAAKRAVAGAGGILGLCSSRFCGGALEFVHDMGAGTIRLRSPAAAGPVRTAPPAAAAAGPVRTAPPAPPAAVAASKPPAPAPAPAPSGRLHVFVDDSNIFRGAQSVACGAPAPPHGNPSRNPAVRVDVAALAALVEGRRAVEQRVVVGSVGRGGAGGGLGPTAEFWRREGYEVHAARQVEGGGEQFVDDTLIAQVWMIPSSHRTETFGCSRMFRNV
jgi:hypothetical protein